jgi:hypothetical protein
MVRVTDYSSFTAQLAYTNFEEGGNRVGPKGGLDAMEKRQISIPSRILRAVFTFLNS